MFDSWRGVEVCENNLGFCSISLVLVHDFIPRDAGYEARSGEMENFDRFDSTQDRGDEDRKTDTLPKKIDELSILGSLGGPVPLRKPLVGPPHLSHLGEEKVIVRVHRMLPYRLASRLRNQHQIPRMKTAGNFLGIVEIQCGGSVQEMSLTVL